METASIAPLTNMSWRLLKAGRAGTGKIGLQGMGGIGKTVLAAALARDSEVRLAFSDGIYWLTLGQKPNQA